MLKPLRDTVFAKKVEEKNRDRGGILLPEVAKEGEYFLVEIVAVGPEAHDLEPGDVCYYKQRLTQDAGNGIIVCKYENILAKKTA